MPDMELAVQHMSQQNFDPKTTSILVLSHVRSTKIKKMTEVYQYSILQFIADSGGTLGIFVGISMYSIYLELIQLFYRKVSLFIS